MSGNKPPSSNPSTPVVPRVKTTNTNQRTASTSRNLHPNVTTRSPNLSAGRKARADTISSADTLTPIRPLSVAGNRPACSTGSKAPKREIHEQSSGRNSPMFFRANEVPQLANYQEQQNLESVQTPKVIIGDNSHLASSSSGSNLVGSQSSRTPKNVPSSPRLGLSIPLLVPASRQNGQISPPVSRRSTVALGQQTKAFPGPSLDSLASNQSTTAIPQIENRNHVRFVYANGTEELLLPRYSGSEASSVKASPPLAVSPEFPNTTSPTGIDFALSSPSGSPNLLASPPHYFQRRVVPPHSRRASLEYTPQIGRHSRSVSISSPIASEILLGTGDRINHTTDSNYDTGLEIEPGDEEHAQPASSYGGKGKLQKMEELAANARRERKVMDLEISNTSLMAINKALEREMRRQATELRRFKRLSRSGRLSTHPLSAKTSLEAIDTSDTVSESDTFSVAGAETDYSGSEQEHVEKLSGEEGEEDEDTEIESLCEEEEEESDGDSEGFNDEKHRAVDEHRLEQDLSKHKVLLEASVKMNASLKRCQYVTDQLIREGKKALQYKVKPSEVKLGGRVVFEDEDLDEEVDYIHNTEDFDDGGVRARVSPLLEQNPVRHSLL